MSYGDLAERAGLLARGWRHDRSLLWIDTSDPLDGVVAIVACWATGRPFALLAAGEIPAFTGTPRIERAPYPVAAAEADDDQLVVFSTSGTTGTPRHVAHTAATLASGLLATLAIQAELLGATVPASVATLDGHSVEGFATGSAMAIGMSVATISGYTVVQRTLGVGDTFAALDTRRPETIPDQLATLDAISAAVPSLTASLLRRHLRHTSARPAASRLLSFGIGGALVPSDVAAELEELLGCQVTNGYGSTELGGPALIGRVSDPPEVRHRSVGRPLPGVQARIEAPDSDGWGRLSLSSRAASIGLIDPDDATVRPWPSPWLDTGDIARRSEDGTYVIAGRGDEVILRAGRRIDPTPIRKWICDHPHVAAAAVLAVASRVDGEFDIAAVVAGNVTEAELRRWLAGTEIPRVRHLAIVDELPVARDGNVSLAAARALLAARNAGLDRGMGPSPRALHPATGHDIAAKAKRAT